MESLVKTGFIPGVAVKFGNACELSGFPFQSPDRIVKLFLSSAVKSTDGKGDCGDGGGVCGDGSCGDGVCGDVGCGDEVCGKGGCGDGVCGDDGCGDGVDSGYGDGEQEASPIACGETG